MKMRPALCPLCFICFLIKYYEDDRKAERYKSETLQAEIVQLEIVQPETFQEKKDVSCFTHENYSKGKCIIKNS